MRSSPFYGFESFEACQGSKMAYHCEGLRF